MRSLEERIEIRFLILCNELLCDVRGKLLKLNCWTDWDSQDRIGSGRTWGKM